MQTGLDRIAETVLRTGSRSTMAASSLRDDVATTHCRPSACHRPLIRRGRQKHASRLLSSSAGCASLAPGADQCAGQDGRDSMDGRSARMRRCSHRDEARRVDRQPANSNDTSFNASVKNGRDTACVKRSHDEGRDEGQATMWEWLQGKPTK